MRRAKCSLAVHDSAPVQVYATASAAILDVYLRARFQAPHLIDEGAPPEGGFVPSATVWAKMNVGANVDQPGATFAVPGEKGPDHPPVGFVFKV